MSENTSNFIPPADGPTISAFGEKRLIAEFIRPLFNRENLVGGVGDDCAMIEIGNDELMLLSTDRVPADLTAFRLGIIEHYGLGRYLACLNLSDIAACGGKPEALLLNLGLPSDLPYRHFQDICRGFGDLADHFGCRVLGGDVTHSKEISISATSVGRVPKNRVLTRRGAKPGDSIFVAKPIGLTPAAFAAYLRSNLKQIGLSLEELDQLGGQFSQVLPMIDLASRLSSSGQCSSCMDNTDGLGQSLFELGSESNVALVVSSERLVIPPIVEKIASAVRLAPITLAMSAGADFSLVGTLRGSWTSDEATRSMEGLPLQIIGFVDAGSGVWLESGSVRSPLEFSAWNYFQPNANESESVQRHVAVEIKP